MPRLMSGGEQKIVTVVVNSGGMQTPSTPADGRADRSARRPDDQTTRPGKRFRKRDRGHPKLMGAVRNRERAAL